MGRFISRRNIQIDQQSSRNVREPFYRDIRSFCFPGFATFLLKYKNFFKLGARNLYFPN